MNGKSYYSIISKDMGMLMILLFLGGLLTTMTWAENRMGLGLMAGVSQSRLTSTSGLPEDYSGNCFGIDFQFPLGKFLSLNPFYIIAKESGSQTNADGIPEDIDLDTTSLGVHLRIWFRDFFMGVHTATYDVDIIVKGMKVGTLEDTGTGFALGYENPGGFFVTLRTLEPDYHIPEISSEDLNVKTTRALLGYRF